MEIDRVIDWDYPPTMLDFFDFGGSINFVLELPLAHDLEDFDPEEVDFKQLRPYVSTTAGTASISTNPEEDSKKYFKDLGSDATITPMEPDRLSWHALKSKPEYEKDISNMRYLMRMIFK